MKQMKHSTLTPQDLVDITEHFRTMKHIPEQPLTAEQQAVKDALGRELDAQFDIPPPIDVPEPVIRFADMVNISSTIIALIFLLYAGAFIGYIIACLLR